MLGYPFHNLLIICFNWCPPFKVSGSAPAIKTSAIPYYSNCFKFDKTNHSQWFSGLWFISNNQIYMPSDTILKCTVEYEKHSLLSHSENLRAKYVVFTASLMLGYLLKAPITGLTCCMDSPTCLCN